MKLFLCGDVMTGRGIDQILEHSVPPVLFEGYVKDARDYILLAERVHGSIPRMASVDYIWGDALEIWEEERPHVKIINLETAVTTSDQAVMSKGINYRMHPQNLAVLKCAGVDICTLANNHVMDWGEEGLQETLLALKNSSMKYAGAGKNISKARAPAIMESEGGRVLVFSACLESSGVPWDWQASEQRPGVFLLYNLDCLQEIRELVELYKKTDDLIVFSIHWGGNWGDEIPSSQQTFARGLIDVAGVDIVHGHSSHHPKAVEIYRGRPILYGCGDFINDYEGIRGHETYRADLVMMYFIEGDLHPFSLKSLRLYCLKIRKFKLIRPQSDEFLWLRHKLNQVSAPFSTSFEVLKEGVLEIKLSPETA